MKYKIREGIVYTTVCDIPLLITTLRASEYCPPVMELSALKSTFWRSFERGLNEDEFMEILKMPPRMKEETVRVLYRRFFKEMTEKNYLILEDHDAQ